MKISTGEFLARYDELFLANTPGISIFAYWKMKYCIETGDAYYLPEYNCYYLIRNNHLLVYHSPDNQMHLSEEELNQFDCISLPAAMFDSVKEKLTGFNVSYGWNLCYDFTYSPQEDVVSLYEAVDFDFSDPSHYVRAAEIINGADGWFTADNVKKMTTYAAFHPSFWFFVRDKASQALAAVGISAYDAAVKQTDLDWIYVAPEYQGKGCGRFLIEEVIRRCKNISDSIRVSGTVDFYRQCGFADHEFWAWAPKDGYEFDAPGIQP